MRQPKTKAVIARKTKVHKAPPLQQPTPPPTDRATMDELIGLVDEELLRLAFAIRRRDPGATQRSETLVHETWIRLKNLLDLARLPASEFMAIAARVMRQVL
jgi:hypothetical protein